LDIPSIPLENLINNLLKIISGESSPIIPADLKNQLKSGKILQGEVVKVLPNGKATISIEGQKIIAELSPDKNLQSQENSNPKKPEYPFKSGQKIYIQVGKVHPEPILKLVSAPKQNFQEEGYRTNLSHKIEPEIIGFENVNKLKLPADKIARVTVSQIKNKSEMSFKIGGEEILVRTAKGNSYRVGDTVHVEFKKTANGYKPILTDHLENGKKIDLEFIKPYLPSRKPLGKLVGELTRDVLGSPVLKELNVKPEFVERLRTTLSALTPKPDVIPDNLEIKRQVDKSGIRYESKIKQFLTELENPKIKAELASDLKGQLLNLIKVTDKNVKSYLGQNQRLQIAEFQQRIKLAVDSIELNQLSSLVSKQENQPLVLQIPNPLSSNDKTIELFIRESSGDEKTKGNADKSSYSLAFFLDLSSLGSMKINAKIGSDDFAVRIDVEQDEVAKFIQKYAGDFEKRMKNIYSNTTVECFVNEKVSPVKDNFIELFVSQNTSLLSVKT
tara:strand:- start:1340 stop:2842 length:1503 start_codon:yes stop_codon:yes gene_type:complete